VIEADPTSATKPWRADQKAQQTILADLGIEQVFPKAQVFIFLLDAALAEISWSQDAAPASASAQASFKASPRRRRDAQLECDPRPGVAQKIAGLLPTNDPIRLAANRQRPCANTYKGITKKLMERPILSEASRVDGRNLDECGDHGGRRRAAKRCMAPASSSAGSPQVLSWPPSHPQRCPGDWKRPQPDGRERPMLHHYNFPPYSSAETRPDALPRPPRKSATAPSPSGP